MRLAFKRGASGVRRAVRAGGPGGYMQRRFGSSIQMLPSGELRVPDDPIIPFIEGDGTGPDIWAASVRVLDAAVALAYDGRRKIEWKEVLAGDKAYVQTGEWLPKETMDAFREHYVGLKGPLSSRSDEGVPSLTVAIRQGLDLYAGLRPIRWFQGAPSPVKHPGRVDMVIFRENVEDMYSGVEFPAGSEDAKKLYEFLRGNFPERVRHIRSPECSGFGVKPMSRDGTERIVRAALMFAIENQRSSVTMVHKGNVMRHTEGAFRDWGYEVGRGPDFRPFVVTERESLILDNHELGTVDPVENARLLEPGLDVLSDRHQRRVLEEVEECLSTLGATHGGGKWRQMVLLRDTLLETAFQQSLTRPEDFDIICTTNLNGQYLSDALSAQVGGTGISPGANINYKTGHAVFEATHGTAPKYADMDKVNPGSMILSGEMMLRFLGWTDAADLILRAMDTSIRQRLVTYDFARQMEDATVLRCSEFANALIERM